MANPGPELSPNWKAASRCTRVASCATVLLPSSSPLLAGVKKLNEADITVDKSWQEHLMLSYSLYDEGATTSFDTDPLIVRLL